MSKLILVAGDVCLDVVGVPMPRKADDGKSENWQLTGEMRTHYLAGGAMLLAQMIRAAVGEGSGWAVAGPQPIRPKEINEGPDGALPTADFLAIAPRLCRQEIVHSLLELNEYPKTSKPREKTLRVELEAGFSGPAGTPGNPGAQPEPSLDIHYAPEPAQVIVLDDTGNGFRRDATHNPWPQSIKSVAKEHPDETLIIYKLHRPLPKKAAENPLWDRVADSFPERRLVILSVDDLRAAGVTISHGLSWERTALDVVWQLLNAPAFALLRQCPWLIIRLGLDGAILWQRATANESAKHHAWLIYDSRGIEGGHARTVSGAMVGSNCAFTAAVVKHVAPGGLPQTPPPDGPLSDDTPGDAYAALLRGIKAGILAVRRLLEYGYGDAGKDPGYPRGELFDAPRKGEASLACQPIPIIPGALVPDRGGWRLLDQVFANNTSLLHLAVTQLATKAKGTKASASADEVMAARLLEQAPLGIFGKLRTHDRHEMESYRSLHTLLRDYLCTAAPSRPLSIAVFGPPGAGKSFGVKEVAASLQNQPGCREVVELTFNLSLYQKADELAGAFHLVRDVVLDGKVPLVFFDEFDTALEDHPLGWLRHFLAPMQDGKFLDRGAPHPIGPAIFVFAGGTCATYREFAEQPDMSPAEFRRLKGPDFLSRLRAKLDIPSLNLMTACCPRPDPSRPDHPRIQDPGTYDPFGPTDALPCEAAILLRRAAILSFNLAKKAPCLVCADESLDVDAAVLRALLFMPVFKHGNRSFEALMDMSHLADIDCLTPSFLPAQFQIPLHADAGHFCQLVGTAVPYSPEDRERIAEEVHKAYLEQRRKRNEYKPKKASHQEWGNLDEKYRHSNREQADDIPRKLRLLGLWLRKRESPVKGPGQPAPLPVSTEQIESAARFEHDRWVASMRTGGWVYGPVEDRVYRTHPCILPWESPGLSQSDKDKDRDAIREIPRFLNASGYEVIEP